MTHLNGLLSCSNLGRVSFTSQMKSLAFWQATSRICQVQLCRMYTAQLKGCHSQLAPPTTSCSTPREEGTHRGIELAASYSSKGEFHPISLARPLIYAMHVSSAASNKQKHSVLRVTNGPQQWKAHPTTGCPECPLYRQVLWDLR